ncbi:MAG: RNB domain-containing ribonuclease [Nitriliruptoraceae bacterium]|nr:RNB domain-containing ribonuclease [Nitriliruptoraceae bacterium]
MPTRARFRPHPRGFGFATPVATDGLTEIETTVTDAEGATATVDGIFVPPPTCKGFLADDLVDVEVAIDDKGASAASMTLVARSRRMLVGTVQQGPGRLVIEPDPALGSGWVRLDEGVAAKLQLAVGRQVVVLVGDGEDGAAIGRALVAGPHVPASPQAIRAASVVVALGRAAPGLIPGGPEAAGLDPVEAATTHNRIVGLLAGGGRGGAAGLDPTGPVPGVDAPWSERRDEPCVTIDSASTRDIDDAVAASWDGADDTPVQVAVHIADVARAIGIGSDADRYARTVAATAYLAVGDNAPMLDPALSEGALSLVPDEDRWALSARFGVLPDGSITAVEIEAAAVRSRAKLSYEALERWMEDDRSSILAEAGSADVEVEQVLTAALEASRRLGAERDGRVTFEELFTDVEVEPGLVDGKLTTVEASPHADAYRLIERLMVAANEAVAGWLVTKQVPALYRAHAGLDPERLERLRAAVALAGAEVPALEDDDAEADVVVGQIIAAIDAADAAGRHAERDLLVSVAASSTARATYEPDPSAHTGLASAAYTHFTSPIRRYADLVVHRQIRAALGDESPPHRVEDLRPLATWLDARAGAMSYLQARERAELWSRLFDRGFLDGGEPATVTGVTANGLRIRLPRLGVSGFVTAERALDLPGKERGSLQVDEHGLTTTSGPWQVGSRVTVRFAGLDNTGRANWRLGQTPAAA